MRILHSADWHLDSPFIGRTDEQTRFLRQQLLSIPDKITALCKAERCDLLLLAGDLFDGAYTKESFHAVYKALEEVNIPVFISPGNHDFCQSNSPYAVERWPENVHIFRHPVMEKYPLPELDCDIYGAGYEAMDCPALLKDFHADGENRWQIGILHSDPLQSNSSYAPLTAQQVKDSGLHYLALGHVHKFGNFRSGDTLCAWPGCPMGRGNDETGLKGALVIELGEKLSAQFLPMNTIRFYDETIEAGDDPLAAVAALLPPVPTQDFYRVTFSGYAAPMDLAAISAQLSHIPNLELRDRTLPEVDLWSNIGEDNLEGMYFKLLHDALDTDSEIYQQRVKLAAKISRQILDGQEVVLP